MSVQQVLDSSMAKAPPVAVAGLSFVGVPLQDWVYIMTLVWLTVQISYTVWKWVKGKKQ